MAKTLVVIDIQNDITKNYKGIIDNLNDAINWAVNNNVHVVYIRHENLSSGTRTFKTNTRGAELVSDLKIVSDNIFTKYKPKGWLFGHFHKYMEFDFNDCHFTVLNKISSNQKDDWFKQINL